MSKIGTWSTTAGNNNAAPPDGWPEGQAPSTVNDCARENMAAIRTYAQTAQWFDHGLSPTFVSASTFTVPGSASVMESQQQLQLFVGASGTIYRSIATVSASAVSTTVILNAGTALTSSLSSFAVSILTPTNSAIPLNLSLFSVTLATLSANIITTVSLSASTASINVLVLGGTTLSSVATQAQMETGALLDVAVSPGRQQFHPSAAKGWVTVDTAGGIQASYNVASVNDNGVGIIAVNWATDFSGPAYAPHAQVIVTPLGGAATTMLVQTNNSLAAGSAIFTCIKMSDFLATDPNYWSVVAFGDQ